MIEIFVFGSNLAGRHGKGAAKFALENYGAIYGQGEGLQGKSYGIPTKDEHLKTLPLLYISHHILKFLTFAVLNSQYYFNITAIGCGLAGYKPKDIAPLFAPVIDYENCRLPEEFIRVLNETNAKSEIDTL